MKPIPIFSTRGLLVLGMLLAIVGLFLMDLDEGATALLGPFGWAAKALYDERDSGAPKAK